MLVWGKSRKAVYDAKTRPKGLSRSRMRLPVEMQAGGVDDRSPPALTEPSNGGSGYEVSKKTLIMIAAALLAFWMIDIPQTVRAKVAVLNMMPLSPRTLNSQIKGLCAGAHSGMKELTCYSTFHNHEAAAAVLAEDLRKMRCEETTKKVKADSKNWMKSENDQDGSLGESYIFIGNDAEFEAKVGTLPMFFPERCIFFSLSKGASTWE